METLLRILRKRIHIKGKHGNPGARVPIYVLLLIVFLIATYYTIRHSLYADEWDTFTYDGAGFSIDYPIIWHAKGYGTIGGRGPNLEFLRARFNGTGTVSIYQQPMENPELVDAANWGQEIIQRFSGYDLSTLQEVQIGYGSYPALMQTYKTKGFPVRFNRVAYLVTQDGVFMLDFGDKQSRYEESELTFDRMLASFRILE